MNIRTLNEHVANAALIDLAEQLRERDVGRSRALPRVLEQSEQSQQQKNDNHPEGEVTQIGVHPASLFTARGPRGLI